MTDIKFFQVSVADHVATVVFNRPPVNAVNIEVYAEIPRVFNALGANPDVRVAILASASEKAWCAGADLKDFGARTPDTYEEERGKPARAAFDSVYECAVPVIAAVNGAALGTGVALASCCDIIIASEEAVFGLPEVNVGSLGGAKHLQRLVPHLKMRRMLLTGQRISGKELMQFGSVDRVVPRSSLMVEARDLALEIACKSPITIRLAKQSLNETEFMGMQEGYIREQTYTARLTGYEDTREAARAFLEKRPPQFQGR